MSARARLHHSSRFLASMVLHSRRGLHHYEGVGIVCIGGRGVDLFPFYFLVNALDVLDHLLIIRCRHFPVASGGLLHLKQCPRCRGHHLGRI